MNNLFSVQMSSSEARTLFFKSIEGKTENEVEKIKKEYAEILPKIMDREFELASKGWLIN
mgnify:CR=1 FL=1